MPPIAYVAEGLRRLRLMLCVVLGLWVLWTLSGLLWHVYPDSPAAVAQTEPVNDVGLSVSARSINVDVEAMRAWHLFGKQADAAATQQVVISNEPTDIERGAKETRLNLLLRGVLASDEGEAGRAMIESQGKQDVYSLGEKLPVGGRVTLARILPDRVILDNAGKYELLRLFEDKSDTVAVLQAPTVNEEEIEDEPDVASMANDYRERLYSNPQSLADVVKISAVRQGGQMQGYRVSPGRDRDQFSALGFQANDVVTQVNGIELNDPAKAMELYRLMRSASEASFTVLRGGEEHSLVVNLGDAVQ